MSIFPFTYLIKPWVVPPGLNFLFILCGLLFSRIWPLTGKVVFFFGLITLYLFSTPFIAYQMIDLLQNKYKMLSPYGAISSQPNQAIVVLGGGDSIEAEYGNKRTVSDATLHRLNYAVFLQKKTQLPIIVSGGKPHTMLESEADLMANILNQQYKIENVIKENKSKNTAEESHYLASLLKKYKLKKIYLVTNAWHMTRSVAIFSCAGIDVIPAPMGYYLYGPGYNFISFFPNKDALYASAVAIHEFIGLAWYSVYYSRHCKN